MENQEKASQSTVNDESTGINFWWGVLSFVIPVVGIVLQIVWWKNRRSNAKACMIGWIIGIVAPIVLSLAFGLIASSGVI